MAALRRELQLYNAAAVLLGPGPLIEIEIHAEGQQAGQMRHGRRSFPRRLWDGAVKYLLNSFAVCFGLSWLGVLRGHGRMIIITYY